MDDVERRDLLVIGAGPAGAAAAMRAAGRGASVVVFERGQRGRRDKVCGDGLTPRAVGALQELKLDVDAAHRIDGLRMIAGRTQRELAWPATSRFPGHGAVWPRRRFDTFLMDAASDAGAEILYGHDALPLLDDAGRVIGVEAGGRRWHGDLVVLATGAPGPAPGSSAPTVSRPSPSASPSAPTWSRPRHAEHHIESCLTLTDDHGTPVPGYGWMFPAGDGTVNIGVGALSTMKGFKRLTSTRCSTPTGTSCATAVRRAVPGAAARVAAAHERAAPPRAGWVAVGDAAGLVNPMNGEGIDYGLESGMLAATSSWRTRPLPRARYDAEVGARFDAFLRTGRRFSFLIGHPWILKPGLRLAVGTQAVADITLQVMGNLVDSETPGASGRVLRIADRTLALLDPLLRRTRAAA